jgi:hypothetical protein
MIESLHFKRKRFANIYYLSLFIKGFLLVALVRNGLPPKAWTQNQITNYFSKFLGLRNPI